MEKQLKKFLTSGWKLFPIKRSNKAPYTDHGLDDATDDPDQIERWIKEYPGCNFGVALGTESNVCAIDIDHNVQEKLEELKEMGLPDGVMLVKTNRGIHIYISRNEPTKSRIFADCELRANGCYAVIPGSRHASGAEYEIISGDPAHIATASSFIETFIKKEEKLGKTRKTLRKNERIPEGARNSTLTSEAGRMRARGLDEAEILSGLRSVNEELCSPPLPDSEVANIAHSVAKYEPGYPPTDMGDAERLSEKMKVNTVYCVDFRKWYHWDGELWGVDHSLEIIQKIKMENRKLYAAAAQIDDDKERRAVVGHGLSLEMFNKIRMLEELCRSHLAITPDRFDADPWLLNCQNGILNLKTGELMPHDPARFMTKIANANFNPEGECPRFTQFLDEIFNGNIDLIRFVQCIAGMTLVGSQLEQAIFIFYGSGANGKTVLINILSYVLGDYAIQSPVETIMAKKQDGIPNDVARLRGARLVSTSESPEGRSLNEARIKALVGGDIITARFLHAEFFEFVPEFTLLFATNHRPIIKGTDYAIWRRIKLVPFNVTIPPEKQDPRLLEKLKSEGDGILRWACQGLARYMKHGMIVPEEVITATGNYRDEMDALGDFFDSNCELDGWAYFREIFEAYRDYCEQAKEEALSQRRLGVALQERGFVITLKKNRRAYIGIRLKEKPMRS